MELLSAISVQHEILPTTIVVSGLDIRNNTSLREMSRQQQFSASFIMSILRIVLLWVSISACLNRIDELTDVCTTFAVAAEPSRSVSSTHNEALRLHLLHSLIGGGDINDSDAVTPGKSKASKASASKNTDTAIDFYSNQYNLMRGTRTTGVGASKRRNPSIFTASDSLSTYQTWTAAALAGDVLNRKTNSNCSKKMKKKKKKTKRQQASNSMTGRLWVRQSDRGTLILKFPADNEKDLPLQVELSERTYAINSTSTSLSTDTPSPTIQARFVTDELQHDSSPFVSVEGIYGVYDLPCSGPHAALITDSEEVYTSSLSSSGNTVSSLLELRRIKSLEIVSLRHKTNESYEHVQSSADQLAEEARQLRLLRNSFKEHDFYYTVPRLSTSQSTIPVVQDVTHPLQRSFLEWAAQTKDHQNTSKNAGHRWWIPYFEEASGKSTRRHVVDPRFFWNEQPALALLNPLRSHEDVSRKEKAITQSPYGLLLDHVIPVTSAFVGVQRDILIPSSPTSAVKESYDQLLISRRSKYRTGTRFTRRGNDDTGNVANYAETEQICFILSNDEVAEVYSHVQTRGSIPLHWSSPADVKTYRPRVYIGVDPDAQARGLRDHLLGELWWYSSSAAKKSRSSDSLLSKFGIITDDDDTSVKLAMVNLIDKHGDQGRLGTTFDTVLSAVLDVYDIKPQQLFQRPTKSKKTEGLLHPGSVKHIWYDFHAECKGGRWDRLGQLLDQVMPTLEEQGYFSAAASNKSVDQWDIKTLQDGVVRTNCMDCLDRTNVVQSIFARYVLYRQLHDRPASSKARRRRTRTLPLECVTAYKQRPLTLPWTEGEASHRHLWADNADAISRLYAGTPALKGDFTRTGTRTKRGALDDGLNSLQRYYLNNFIDADRQEGMDLLAGNAEFHLIPFDDDAELSRVFLLQELSRDKRRGFNKDHLRIKVKGNDTTRKLTLAWLPGDLRHHMKSEALRSRSPLSSAAMEERIRATKSSDFLMKVTSSAVEPIHSFLDVNTIERLQSIDRRALSARPWWALVDSSQNIDAKQLSDNKNEGAQSSSFTVTCGPMQSRVLVSSLMLLLKLPVLSASLIALLIGIGLDDELDGISPVS